jgi:hypothetical protein
MRQMLSPPVHPEGVQLPVLNGALRLGVDLRNPKGPPTWAIEVMQRHPAVAYYIDLAGYERAAARCWVATGISAQRDAHLQANECSREVSGIIALETRKGEVEVRLHLSAGGSSRGRQVQFFAYRTLADWPNAGGVRCTDGAC